MKQTDAPDTAPHNKRYDALAAGHVLEFTCAETEGGARADSGESSRRARMGLWHSCLSSGQQAEVQRHLCAHHGRLGLRPAPTTLTDGFPTPETAAAAASRHELRNSSRPGRKKMARAVYHVRHCRWADRTRPHLVHEERKYRAAPFAFAPARVSPWGGVAAFPLSFCRITRARFAVFRAYSLASFAFFKPSGSCCSPGAYKALATTPTSCPSDLKSNKSYSLTLMRAEFRPVSQ